MPRSRSSSHFSPVPKVHGIFSRKRNVSPGHSHHQKCSMQRPEGDLREQRALPFLSIGDMSLVPRFICNISKVILTCVGENHFMGQAENIWKKKRQEWGSVPSDRKGNT